MTNNYDTLIIGAGHNGLNLVRLILLSEVWPALWLSEINIVRTKQ